MFAIHCVFYVCAKQTMRKQAQERERDREGPQVRPSLCSFEIWAVMLGKHLASMSEDMLESRTNILRVSIRGRSFNEKRCFAVLSWRFMRKIQRVAVLCIYYHVRTRGSSVASHAICSSANTQVSKNLHGLFVGFRHGS